VRGKGRADQSGFERKKIKQAERRRTHHDKYADRASTKIDKAQESDDE
jgi:hypothetical protein